MAGLTPSITCPQCGRTSYHPQDIRHMYCGNCHQFHDTMKGLDTMSNENCAACGKYVSAGTKPRADGFYYHATCNVQSDFIHLANFILLGCLYEAFAKEGFDKPDAVCHPRFIGRFRYWQNITLDGHLPAKWVDEVVVTLTRANTTPR